MKKIKKILALALATIMLTSCKHNEYKRTEAYKKIPTYKEVAIDYMDMNKIGRDCEKDIRINRHYKANDTTLVYCGQNTIFFRDIISFNSIYVFESEQVEMFVVHKWVYKGSYEV